MHRAAGDRFGLSIITLFSYYMFLSLFLASDLQVNCGLISKRSFLSAALLLIASSSQAAEWHSRHLLQHKPGYTNLLSAAQRYVLAT